MDKCHRSQTGKSSCRSEEESAVEEGAAITESVVYKCPSSGTDDLTLSGE